MSRALVTGARGFIGRHVARALMQRGYAVAGLGRGAWADHASWGVGRYLEGEVSAAVLPRERYDVIVHCAGGSSVGKSIDDPQAELAKTVPACEALLEWMRAGPSRGAHVVIVSSGAVYGDAPQQPIDEMSPLQPVSPYGTHKLRCEELARKYASTHGMAVSIVRLFSIYGAGLERQLLWDAARKAGSPQFAGSGNERRDWLHVSDAARLLIVAAEAATSDVPTFNGGSGEGTRVADIVRQLYRELSVDEQPRFDGSSRAGDPPDYIADISRARALGWAPEVTLGVGLREYARWFASCR